MYMYILHVHLQQVTVLKEGLHGFVFESNRGTRVTMTANSPLGPQFNFGWNNKKGKKFKTKSDVTRDKVSYITTILSHVTTLVYTCTCMYVYIVHVKLTKGRQLFPSEKVEHGDLNQRVHVHGLLYYPWCRLSLGLEL